MFLIHASETRSAATPTLYALSAFLPTLRRPNDRRDIDLTVIFKSVGAFIIGTSSGIRTRDQQFIRLPL